MKVIWLLIAVMFGTVSISRGEIYATAQDVADAADNARTNACFDPVGLLIIQFSNAWWVAGSSVLIDRQFALLTPHQLRLYSNYTGVAVVFRSGTNNIARVTADWWGIHPGCPVGTPTGSGVDLAMLHFSEPVTNIAPATLFTGEVPIPVLMYMAGFGVPGVAGSGYWTYDVIKRAGCNIVGDIWSPLIESQYVMCKFTRLSNGGQPLEWQLSDYDSGCGWFINTNGQMQLAALGSFAGPTGNWDFGSSSGALNLTLYRDWITRVMSSFTPTLTATKTNATSIKLSWPSPAPGFVLQQSPDSGNGTNWVNVATTPDDDGTNISVVVNMEASRCFWRLIKP